MKKLEILVILLILATVLVGCGSSSSSTNSTAQCKVCYKEFSLGTDDSKSIFRKNMCVRCFTNYEAGMKLKNAL